MATAPLNFWLLVLPLFFCWNAGVQVSAQEFWNLTASSTMPVNEGSSLTFYCATNNNDSSYYVRFSRASTTSFSSQCSTYMGNGCSYQYWCNSCNCYSGSSSGVRRYRYNIYPVQLSHGGTWRCEHSSSSSSMRSNELIVRVDGKPTRPSLSPETSAVAEGVDVTLTCSSNATSMPASIRTPLVYSWRKDGGTISGGTGTRLTLRNVQQSHQGRYTCTAQESGKSLSSDPSDVLFLDVQYPPRSVTLDPPDSSYQVRETTGSVPTIRCQADCDPQCLFRWTDKGGNAVGNTGSRLQLNTLSRNEAGVFTCSAFNQHGMATATVSISVTYPPEVRLSPQQTSRLGRLEEGDNVTVQCLVEASPPANVSWTRLTASGKERESVASTPELRLIGVGEQDSGTYTCTASNRVSSHPVTAEASVSLHVTSPAQCQDTTTPSRSSLLIGGTRIDIFGTGLGIGVAIGCVISGLIATLIYFLFLRKRRSEDMTQEEDRSYENLDPKTRRKPRDNQTYQNILQFKNQSFEETEEGPGSSQAVEEEEEDKRRQAAGEAKKQSQKAEVDRKKGNTAEKDSRKSKVVEKGDRKSKAGEKGDRKSKVVEKGDRKSKAGEKGDRKSKAGEKGDRKSKVEENGDSKSKVEEKGDSKSKAEEKGDSKSKAEGKGDRKSKAEEKRDRKSKAEEKGNRKSKAEEIGDRKSKAEGKNKGGAGNEVNQAYENVSVTAEPLYMNSSA